MEEKGERVRERGKGNLVDKCILWISRPGKRREEETREQKRYRMNDFQSRKAAFKNLETEGERGEKKPAV